ncbi:unnamed protein product [Urochloa humidicola]
MTPPLTWPRAPGPRLAPGSGRRRLARRVRLPPGPPLLPRHRIRRCRARIWRWPRTATPVTHAAIRRRRTPRTGPPPALRPSRASSSSDPVGRPPGRAGAGSGRGLAAAGEIRGERATVRDETE